MRQLKEALINNKNIKSAKHEKIFLIVPIFVAKYEKTFNEYHFKTKDSWDAYLIPKSVFKSKIDKKDFDDWWESFWLVYNGKMNMKELLDFRFCINLHTKIGLGDFIALDKDIAKKIIYENYTLNL